MGRNAIVYSTDAAPERATMLFYAKLRNTASTNMRNRCREEALWASHFKQNGLALEALNSFFALHSVRRTAFTIHPAKLIIRFLHYCSRIDPHSLAKQSSSMLNLKNDWSIECLGGHVFFLERFNENRICHLNYFMKPTRLCEWGSQSYFGSVPVFLITPHTLLFGNSPHHCE